MSGCPDLVNFNEGSSFCEDCHQAEECEAKDRKMYPEKYALRARVAELEVKGVRPCEKDGICKLGDVLMVRDSECPYWRDCHSQAWEYRVAALTATVARQAETIEQMRARDAEQERDGYKCAVNLSEDTCSELLDAVERERYEWKAVAERRQRDYETVLEDNQRLRGGTVSPAPEYTGTNLPPCANCGEPFSAHCGVSPFSLACPYQRSYYSTVKEETTVSRTQRRKKRGVIVTASPLTPIARTAPTIERT